MVQMQFLLYAFALVLQFVWWEQLNKFVTLMYKHTNEYTMFDFINHLVNMKSPTVIHYGGIFKRLIIYFICL
jgi:hypothetical protein